jgi:hypothetical protein
VNIEHNKKIDNVYMFESYIIDRSVGKNPMKSFEDLPDGSWFGSYKVDNEEVWNEVKSGTFKGFSIEGLFKYERTTEVINREEKLLSKIINILNKIEH